MKDKIKQKQKELLELQREFYRQMEAKCAGHKYPRMILSYCSRSERVYSHEMRISFTIDKFEEELAERISSKKSSIRNVEKMLNDLNQCDVPKILESEAKHKRIHLESKLRRLKIDLYTMEPLDD